MDNVRAAIEATNQKFASAFSNANPSGVAALYTENAHILPPGSETVEGRTNIESFWQGAMNSGIKEVQIQTLDVEVYGENIAREIGKGVLKGEQGGESVNLTVKYVVIWKKEGSEWKLDVDIWNS
jgi:uncharacterized protein (TIGR02246 family)